MLSVHRKSANETLRPQQHFLHLTRSGAVDISPGADVTKHIFSYTGSRCCRRAKLEEHETLHDYSSSSRFFSSSSPVTYPNNGGHTVHRLALGPQTCPDLLLQSLGHLTLGPPKGRGIPYNIWIGDGQCRRFHAGGHEVGDLLRAALPGFGNADQQFVMLLEVG